MTGFDNRNKAGWNAIADGWHEKLKDLKEPCYEKLTAAESRSAFGRAYPTILINYHHLNGKPILRADKSQLGRARLYGDPDRKYSGRFGDPVALYFPAGLQELLKKAKRIRFVEGEHKADSLVRRRIAAVGFQGVTGWQTKGIPALGFDEIAPHLKGRAVEIPMDSDVPFNPESRAWIKRLGEHLQTYEPKRVLLKALPVLDINAANLRKSKTGVDDFLHHKSLKEYLALPSIDINDPQFNDWDTARSALPELLLNPPPLSLEALTKEPPKIEWVVPGLIAMGELALVNAQAGGGKSSFLMRLMQGVAAGRSVLNFTITRARRVLYVMLERNKDSLERRVFAACQDITMQEHGLKREMIQASFRAIPLAGETLSLINPHHQQWIPNYEVIGQLIEMIKRLGIEVIVFDTLSRLHGGSPSDPALASAICKTCEKIALETGIAIILASHGNKELSHSMYGVGGSGVWVNNTSNMIQLHEMLPEELKKVRFVVEAGTPEPKSEDIIIEFNHYRMSDAPKMPQRWFAISHAKGSMWSIGVQYQSAEEHTAALAKSLTDAGNCVICDWFHKLDRKPFSKRQCIASLMNLFSIGKPKATAMVEELEAYGSITMHKRKDPDTNGRPSYVVSEKVMAAFDPKTAVIKPAALRPSQQKGRKRRGRK